MTKTSELTKKASEKSTPRKDSNDLTKAQALKLEEGFLKDLTSAEQSLISAAIKLDSFVKGRGWTPLGFPTMTEWRIKKVPAAEFYNLRSVNKLIEAGVSPETVKQMRLTNMTEMTRKLPQSAWLDEAWQQDAIKLPVDTFEKKANQFAEESGQHIEEVQRRGFIGSLSLVETWDTAMKVAEIIDSAKSMESRVEAVLAEYLNSNSAVEGKSKLARYTEIMNSEL